MKGSILDFSVSEGRGVLRCEDGNRYSFEGSEWKSDDVFPKRNMQVDFLLDGDEVKEIYSLEKQDSVFCPEETSVAAIISLIFGILSLLLGWWSLALPSLVAIVAGHIGRRNIKKSEGSLGGNSLAVGGLILGYFSLILYTVLILFFVGTVSFMSTY